MLAYMSFPLSNGSFEVNRKRAEKLAVQIMRLNPNLHVLLAHNSTNFSDAVSKFKSIGFDIAIIQKVDMFIIGKPLDYCESCGSVWEYFIAKSLNKKIVTSDYLLGKTNKPDKWKCA